MRKKNICIITPGELPVPAIRGGAVETLVNNFVDINEIDKKFKITVISAFDKKAKEIAYKYHETNIIFIKNKKIYKVVSLFLKIANKILKNNIPSNYYEYAICKRIDVNKFDLFIIEGGDLKKYKYLSSKLGKNKMVAHLHGNNTSNKELDDIYGSVISISEFVKKNWDNTSKISNDNSYVVFNGIDISNFNKYVNISDIINIKRELKIDKDDFVVLFCGRINKDKGIKELIYAINKINDSRLKLLIVGSPMFGLKSKSNFLMEVQQLIDKDKKNILFTGYIHNSELYKYYKLANLVVMPSIWDEPAGLVAIEALASESALIATKVGGLVEYINSDSAFLIERDEMIIDNIAFAIKELMVNKNKYESLVKNSLNQAKKFNREVYYESLSEVINFIIDKNLTNTTRFKR